MKRNQSLSYFEGYETYYYPEYSSYWHIVNGAAKVVVISKDPGNGFKDHLTLLYTLNPQYDPLFKWSKRKYLYTTTDVQRSVVLH